MSFQTVKMNIDGMSNKRNVNAIMKVVGSLDGVNKAEVSLHDRTVTAEFDPGLVSENKIRGVVIQEGFNII